MSLSYEKLLQQLKERKFQPVYFLHGEEPYFIDEISSFIADNVLTESEKGFNQTILYGKDTDVNTIRNACSRYPLMSQYQVVVVKEAQSMKGLAELENYFEKPVPTTILVMCHKYKSLDKRLKMTKVLEKNAVIFESKTLKEKDIPIWINKRLEEQGYKISGKAAHMLAEYLGSDLEKLINALDKLTIGKGQGESVTEKDIEKNVGISREYNIFELTSALGNKDMPKLAKLVNYLTHSVKDNPFPVIISVLYGYFSKLAALYISGKRDKDTMKEMGVMPWLNNEYATALNNYGGKTIPVMKLLQEYDLRFKGVNDTGTPEGELLKELVYKIAFM